MKRNTATALIACLFFLAACGDEEEEDGAAAPAEEAAIVVETPAAGDTVTSPVTVAGTARVFEGTVQIRLLDADGVEITRTFTTASAGAPERGEFSERVPFRIDESQDGTIEVFEENVAPAEGGGYGSFGDPGDPVKLNTVQIPVRLER